MHESRSRESMTLELSRSWAALGILEREQPKMSDDAVENKIRGEGDGSRRISIAAEICNI